ncbi:DNA methyltransferase [Streptomyces sp. NPDC058256]|uniref:DNA methyltransferase n=1 Tax=Streptomyces sp. NPDC058256 TaxID=3346408 RepID=UPI0036DFF83C
MTKAFPHADPRPHLPLSVWATGQPDDPAWLTQGRYLPETAEDLGRMPPPVAAYAIAAYTHPGDTVLDPSCGAGTVLVEALRAGRHAIGITAQSQWWPVARANVTAAKRDGAASDGMVLGGPRDLTTARLSGVAGRVDLALTALRPADLVPLESAATQLDCSSPEPRREGRSTRLCAILAQCRELLRPGGHVVVQAGSWRQHGYLRDSAGLILAFGRAAGLIPVERCIALLAELRGDHLAVHASLAQRRAAARHERAIGHPITLSAHQDVLVFRRPGEAAQAAVLPRPDMPSPRFLLLVEPLADREEIRALPRAYAA